MLDLYETRRLAKLAEYESRGANDLPILTATPEPPTRPLRTVGDWHVVRFGSRHPRKGRAVVLRCTKCAKPRNNFFWRIKALKCPCSTTDKRLLPIGSIRGMYRVKSLGDRTGAKGRAVCGVCVKCGKERNTFLTQISTLVCPCSHAPSANKLNLISLKNQVRGMYRLLDFGGRRKGEQQVDAECIECGRKRTAALPRIDKLICPCSRKPYHNALDLESVKGQVRGMYRMVEFGEKVKGKGRAVHAQCVKCGEGRDGYVEKIDKLICPCAYRPHPNLLNRARVQSQTYGIYKIVDFLPSRGKNTFVTAECTKCGLQRDSSLSNLKKLSCPCSRKGCPHRLDIEKLKLKTYGKLRIAGDAESRKGQRHVLVRCECGEQKVARLQNVLKGDYISCGCESRARLGNKARTHGKSKSQEHRAWARMWNSVRNPNCTEYPTHGGSGIKVCERWSKFENFYTDLGDCPKDHLLYRKDKDKDYAPDNCHWVTREKVYGVLIDGIVKTRRGWCKYYGLSHGTVLTRAKVRGIDFETALFGAKEDKEAGTLKGPQSSVEENNHATRAA